MTTSTDYIKTSYPLPSYQYQVIFPDGNGNTPTISFASVTGLSVVYDTTTYLQSSSTSGSGSPQLMMMPGQSNRSNPISFTRGIINDQNILYLYNWISNIQGNIIDKRDITVYLCDDQANAIVTWKIGNAFPIRLDAPSFIASSNDAAIECLQLLADTITMG